MTETKKKALLIASMASMLDNFNRGNIDILLEIGYELTLASNFCTQADANSKEKSDQCLNEMKTKGVRCVQIDFSRQLFNISEQFKSYHQVKKLLKENFALIHFHSPICAAITRLCAEKYRKKGTKVLYTAHGFHFYKGSSFWNWMLFYPIERFFSRWTDCLITINKEDYYRAKKFFYSKEVLLVPGVGIDIDKFHNTRVDKKSKREEIGLSQEDIMILSVGELNKNKNHQLVIKAISRLKNNKIHYVIAGQGVQYQTLRKLANKLHVSLHLLGFREDIPQLLSISDIFAFPSKREGLGLALVEALVAGKTAVASKIRGPKEIIQNEEGGILVPVKNEKKWSSAIYRLIKDCELKGQKYSIDFEKLKKYGKNEVNETMKKLYQGVLCE